MANQRNTKGQKPQQRIKKPIQAQPAKKNQAVPKGTSLQKTPAPKQNNWQRFLHGKYFFPCVIVVLCVLLYGNTFNNDYAEDDAIYTKANFVVKAGFSDFKYVFTKGTMYGNGLTAGVPSYRPLPLLTLMAETSWFGLNPHVYHRFQVMYYAITCILFFLFMQKITKWLVVSGQWPVGGESGFLAMGATLLFIFHPIHTDVVANVKSRDELMALLFGLLSFYLLLRSIEKVKLKIPSYSWSVIAFGLSLICKETSVSYFIIIPLILYFCSAAKLQTIGALTIPYLCLILIYLFVIRKQIFGNVSFDETPSIMNNSLMAAKNWMDMYATNFVMMGKYLYLLFVPYPLSWDYSYPQFPIVSWSNIWAILSLLVYIAMGIFIITGFVKKSMYSFAMIFFLVTLFLSSNLYVKIACSFGERFLFSPSVGFCMAIPFLIMEIGNWKLVMENRNLKFDAFYGLISKIKFPLPFSKIKFLLLGVILLIYACIVIPRNRDWENDYTLFKSGITTSPNSGRTHGAYASILMDSASSEKNNAARRKFYLLATSQFKRVTQLFTMDPDAFYNLGVCYYGDGYMDSAIVAYKKSLALNPNSSGTNNNLGVIYFNRRQYDSALPYFFKSYKIDTGNVNALLNIGISYENEKKPKLAIRYADLAMKKDSRNKLARTDLCNAYNDVGMDYVNQNKFDSAIIEFQSAHKYDTNLANPIGNIGVAYYREKDYKNAKIYFRKALAKNPGNEQYISILQSLK